MSHWAVCTTYYTPEIMGWEDETHADLATKVYSGRYGTARGVIRLGSRTIFVRPKDLYLAQIEGTARVRLPDGDTYILQYAGHGRWYPVDTPYGLGSRANALVPGRDVATFGWPWGTLIVFDPVHPRLEGHIRPRMFVVDVFGVRAPSHRMDLFVEPGVAEKVEMFYEAWAPARCERITEVRPVRVVQEILAQEGLYQYHVDGVVGSRTIKAAWRWLREHLDLPHIQEDLDVYIQGRYPERLLPRDPAYYWHIRRWACTQEDER